MEIRLDSPILQFDGSIIPKDVEGTPFTLKDVLVNVLGNFTQGTGEEKIHACHLGIEVFGQDVAITFSETDRHFAIRLVKNSSYPALVVGKATKLLEGA
jgi:hypothetical protein